MRFLQGFGGLWEKVVIAERCGIVVKSEQFI